MIHISYPKMEELGVRQVLVFVPIYPGAILAPVFFVFAAEWIDPPSGAARGWLPSSSGAEHSGLNTGAAAVEAKARGRI